MNEYVPELGQAIFGATTGQYEMPEYAVALFDGIMREISRVFWNKNQRDWDPRGLEDPMIPGLAVHPYCWDDGSDAELPNFVFGAVELRWYKYPGRGMSCNVDLEPAKWVDWFDACMKAVRASERT